MEEEAIQKAGDSAFNNNEDEEENANPAPGIGSIGHRYSSYRLTKAQLQSIQDIRNSGK